MKPERGVEQDEQNPFNIFLNDLDEELKEMFIILANDTQLGGLANAPEIKKQIQN